jgi:hypothetical protein
VNAEASFQSAVIDLAHLYGWRVAHFRAARTLRGWATPVGADGKGWPDLFLVHPVRGIALARELKVPPNRLTSEQRQWLHNLSAAGIDAQVWTPGDWDKIQATLAPKPSPQR